MTSLLVAAAQAVPVAGDVEANVRTAADLTRLAGTQGVRLLVLPEAFTTGYDPAAFDQVLATRRPSADDLDGAWLAPLREAAAESGTTVVLSSPLARGEQVHLSMLVVRPTGSVEAAYDKQHVDRSEAAWFAPGERGAVVEVDGVALGLAICYDTRFPEHAAAAAEAGALAYVVSAAYLQGSTRGREVSLPARALDHGMYVVAAAALGTCGTVPLTGGSVVLDPEGHPLAALGDQPGLAVAELDLDALDEVRARQTMHLDRRLGG